MRVTHLSLADFRNYRVAEVGFAAGPNLIVGRNGQGKTNLVEALAYFATLRSHRVSGDAALIRAGADAAIARMKVQALEREVLLEIQLNREGPNRAQVNRNNVRPRELTRWFSVVTFAPEDLSIVRGEPAGRRRFLDDAVISRNPALAPVLADYERVVRQRTSLLKSARATGSRSSLDATLSIWNAQLVDLGTRIMLARRALLQDLSRPLASGYELLVEQDHRPVITLSESVEETLARGGVSRETLLAPASSDASVSRETLSARFHEALDAVRAQELDRAVTLVGPHRDDAIFQLNGLPVKGYASHGESWSFALALRLSLASLLREESHAGDPVIVLDDVFAELDARRRARLMSAVRGFEQVIVTAAVEEDVPKDVAWRTVRIEAGAVIGEENASFGGRSAPASDDDTEESAVTPLGGPAASVAGEGL